MPTDIVFSQTDREERANAASHGLGCLLALAAMPALAEQVDAGHHPIRHLGVSTVHAEQIAEAQSIAPIVCVQNFYNVANRGDDTLIDDLARQGIAYVPYFPLGGFTPLQSSEMETVAARRGVAPMTIALAWLLHRSPNVLLIPGTSSRVHLRENVSAAGIELSEQELSELDVIGAATSR